MPGIERAIQSINQASKNNEDYLSINTRGLTTQDFERLIPVIAQQLPGLKELDLAENDIDRIPDAITRLSGLEVLNLEENALQTLPDVLVQMSNLKTLNLADNNIDEFPQVVTRIPALEHIDLSANNIEDIPRTLGNLGTLTIDLSGNNLNPAARVWVYQNFPEGNIVTDMAANEELQVVGDVLEAMYPDTHEALTRAIDGLDTGAFTTARASNKTAKEVLTEFLSKTPFEGEIATQIYLPVTKSLLDSIMNPALPQEEKDTELQKMATALGNCATPVKSFLIQNAVDQQIRSGTALTPLMETLLDREAVEAKINTSLKDKIRPNEKIEQVQALVNSVFLEGAESHADNKVKISGDRARIPSKTSNINFAFEQVSPELASAFAKLCCETDDTKALVTDTSGNYKLSAAKLKSITSGYRATIGLVTPEENYISKKTEDYKTEVNALLAHPDLMENTTEPDVLDLMDTLSQQQELRVALFKAPEAQREATYQQFLENQKSKIQQVIQKYSPQKEGMAALTVAMNREGRRSPSPDGGEKRKSFSQTSSQPQQKKQRTP